MTSEEYADKLVAEFARLFETEYHSVWDTKAQESEFAAFYIETIQGTGGYVIAPIELLSRAEKSLGSTRYFNGGG